MRRKKTILWAAVGLSTVSGLFCSNPSLGQESDIFGDDTESSAVEDTGNSGSKAPKVSDPLAKSLIDRKTKSPEEAFTVLETLLNLDEKEAAWFYLSRLGNSPLEAEQALAFVESVGTGRILAFTGTEGFPEDKRAWFTGTQKNALDFLTQPETINQTISDLTSQQRETRKVALRRLKATGLPAVSPFLEKVKNQLSDDPSDQTQTLAAISVSLPSQWDQAVREFGVSKPEDAESTTFVLLNRPSNAQNDAFLMSFANHDSVKNNEKLKRSFSRWENRVKGSYGFLPGSPMAEAWVQRKRLKAERIYKDFISGRIAVSQPVSRWSFDPQTGSFSQKEISPFLNAAKDWQFWSFVESQLPKNQSNDLATRNYVEATIRAEKIQKGFDSGLSATAAAAIDSLGKTNRENSGDQSPSGSPVFELLKSTESKKDWIVTQGILQWLEKHLENVDLNNSGQHLEVLIRCLNSPDPRVRTEATLVLLKSNLQSPFAGSSQLK